MISVERFQVVSLGWRQPKLVEVYGIVPQFQFVNNTTFESTQRFEIYRA